MPGLTYQQKEEITRLRGMATTPGDIAAQLGIGESEVRTVLRQRKLRGYLGLIGIFSFFSAIIATPLLYEDHLEGQRVTDTAAIRANLPGEWTGHWSQRGHKRPLRLLFSEDSTDSWSVKVEAEDENCPGNGEYSGSGTTSAKGLTATLVAAHPDCGELEITYVMALEADGKPQLKGEFLRMPTGDVGVHFVTRK